MAKYLLHNFMIDEHIKNALKEDIGFGDISTDFLVTNKDLKTLYLNAREDGVLCGIDVFKRVFKILSNKIEFEIYHTDGDRIKKGERIAKVTGSARFLLTGERTALNYIQRMSGIATKTAQYVKELHGTNAKISDTRKTTPGFRMFEKYAVKVGGGCMHRFNLSDCVMIKDNHIAFASSLKDAVKKIRENISHTHKIEVECDTQEQVIEALEAGADIIMLDNMSYDEMEECVMLIKGKALIEASGGVKLETVRKIAQCGVDIISTSDIVAGAKTLDFGFDEK
ncbi:carboxylating nicotinate-nucleotide diphosphorylase [bacterium]|nr:carboxylating nicotinate-nucleotide diphosphorylase [bacterium]